MGGIGTKLKLTWDFFLGTTNSFLGTSFSILIPHVVCKVCKFVSAPRVFHGAWCHEVDTELGVHTFDLRASSMLS